MAAPTATATVSSKMTVRIRRYAPPTMWWVVAVILTVLLFAPIVRFELRAFDDGIDAFRRMLEYPNIDRIFWNTVALAFGSVALAVPLGTFVAWCTWQLPASLRWVASILPVIPLMLPSIATVSGWTYLLSPRTGIINQALRDIGIGSGPTGPIDVFTTPGIVVVTGFTLTSFVYLFVNASLRQRGSELESAATTCGAGQVKVFFTVTLPLLRPAITYSAGITFLLALGQFTAPLILGAPKQIDVVSTVMYRISADYPVDWALGAALAAPLVVLGFVVVFVQRQVLRDERRYASVSGRSMQREQATSYWPLIPIGIYLFIGVLLPLFALIVVSFSPFWSGSIEPSKFTLSHWSAALNDESFNQAISTTTQAAALTLLIVIPVGYLAAVALARRTRVPGPVRTIIDLLTTTVLSMPGVLMGFAFLLTYTSPPFKLYGTTAMVVVVYSTLLLPHAIRPQLSALLNTGPEYAEASRTCGAGTVRTTARITFPMIRSGIGVAMALTVIFVVHEFAVSLMVTSPRRRVIGSLLYDTTNFGTAPDVAVVALLMVAITTVGILAALVIGGTGAIRSTS